MRMYGVAAFLVLIASATPFAQTGTPLTAVDLEKLKLRVRDEKQST